MNKWSTKRYNDNMYISYQKRIFSFIIDLVLGKIILIGTLFLLAPLIDSLYLSNLLSYTIFTLWTIFNFPFLQSSRWQASVGQKLLRIKVLDVHGNTLSFWRACYRDSLLLFCPWGAFMYFFSPDKQCLHDFLCDSLVVKQRQIVQSIHCPLHQIKYSIIIIAALVLFALPLILWGRLAFLN